MQGVVFSINLKQKIKKIKELNITNYSNKRLNKESIKEYRNLDEYDYLILEHLIIEDIDIVMKHLLKNDNKIIILVSSENDKLKYSKFKNVLVIDVLKEDYIKKINTFIKEDKVIYEQNFLKKLNKHKNIIIGFSLEHKVGSSKYLFELANILSTRNEVLYLEKENSFLDKKIILDLNNKQIKYKKFSIIKNIEENIENKLVIIDYGIALNNEEMKELLKYKNIFIFTKKNKSLVNSQKYIDALYEIEKNNVLIINEEEISSKFKGLSKRKIKKHIYGNVII